MQNQIKRRTYTATDRESARKYYFMGLNLQEVSKLTDIPERTIEKWQQKENWAKSKEPDNIKIKARELKEKGMGVKQIADILKISSTTVWRYCKD